MDDSVNVYNKPLRACCMSPMTGFYRNGCCDTSTQDHGMHTVCVIVSTQFLEFSKAKGNDLITPIPEYQFPGLKEGDKWCLCALRWREAYDAGVAPKVIISATHKQTLEVIELELLEQFAIDN
ncbi:DUF2237 domain-containing protein [Candidatus Marinamargulisbacteria bacterium SCGC AG-410-N11]|nr:DUF2237 domain-containing protein [Candidatus Marinamargulisbacteria bacterium SCGC AG-410-N11]